jgi:hypothetical protein
MLCSRVKNTPVAGLSAGGDVLTTPFCISPAIAGGGGGALTTPFCISPALTERASAITSTEIRRAFRIVFFLFDECTQNSRYVLESIAVLVCPKGFWILKER